MRSSLSKQEVVDLSIGTMGGALNRAIAEQDVSAVASVLSQGTSPDGDRNDKGRPIHLAIDHGSLAIVELLCSKGADVNVRDPTYEGRTPIHMAIRKNSPDILKVLLTHQARPSVRDAAGDTPLHTAIHVNAITSVDLLLKYKANVHLKDASHNFPLHTAVRKNYHSITRMLLNAGASVHIVDASGDWLLHVAARTASTRILEALKERGCDVNKRNAKGSSPLQMATESGNVEAIRWFSRNGAKLDGLDARKKSADGRAEGEKQKHETVQRTVGRGFLFGPKAPPERTPEGGRDEGLARALQIQDCRRPAWLARRPRRTEGREEDKEPAKEVEAKTRVKEALASGDFRNLIQLIAKGTDVDALVLESNDQGMRAVHYAAQSGNVEMLRALKQRKVDLKSLTSKGFTGLHCAVVSGHLDAVRWLVAEAGLDAACRSKGGETALDLAKTLKKTEIALYLNEMTQRRRGAEGTTARLVLQAGRVREGEATQDLNLVKRAREAARTGDVQRVREVLRRGFGVEREFEEATNRGWRLLHFAADRGHSSLVALLIQENANVNTSTEDGMTPLHLASWGGHAEVIGLLLSKGADGNAKTTEGMTAIHLAGMGGHVSSMEALTGTCDIRSVTPEGKSALHLAAEYGNLGAVQWLHLQGLDASERDKKGWTPRQYAKDEGHRKVVEALEKLEKQRSPQGYAQQRKLVKDLQEKLRAKETEIDLLNRQQVMKDRMQERAQAQIKSELQEMREILKAQSEMIARLQSTMLTKGERGRETQN